MGDDWQRSSLGFQRFSFSAFQDLTERRALAQNRGGKNPWNMKKKTTTKKSAATKSGAKKTTGKKTTGRKPAAKKSTGRKPARKRAPVKKAPVVGAISRGRSTLTFLTESIPGFTVGQAKKTRVQAIGGTPPYTFSITQGTLPAGLNFNYMGTLGGTPTQSGYSTIFVKVIDLIGNHLTQAFEVQVDE
jgi:hypothetical protein